MQVFLSITAALFLENFGDILDSIVSIMMKGIAIQTGYVSVSYLGLSFDSAGLYGKIGGVGVKGKASGKETRRQY